MEQGLLVISNAKAGSADERVLPEVLDVLRPAVHPGLAAAVQRGRRDDH